MDAADEWSIDQLVSCWRQVGNRMSLGELTIKWGIRLYDLLNERVGSKRDKHKREMVI